MRDAAPFTIFYRTASGEGGYGCQTCGARRHDRFPRISDAFAAAAHHLSVCRAAVCDQPVEGVALIDGDLRPVVLREGIMVLALEHVA
jgi:hypothetical protein